MPIELMKSKTRKREVVQARQIAMYYAKSLTKNSLATNRCTLRVAKTTQRYCMHVETVNNLMETDKRFRGYIDELNRKNSTTIIRT